MKISVISDTHGSLQGWESALRLISKTDATIHCGDLFSPGFNPLPEQFSPKKLLQEFNKLEKQFLVVRGNCDGDLYSNILAIPVADPFLVYQVSETRILAAHGHLMTEEEIALLAERWKIDILITGHTHKWKLEKHVNLIWLNPGSPSIPKEEPSAAIVDTDKRLIKVCNLDTKEILAESPFLKIS
ncbi:MAG TPA: phosphodiesterase [bacterium]|nr:phosphodiesterase [bacterium]